MGCTFSTAAPIRPAHRRVQSVDFGTELDETDISTVSPRQRIKYDAMAIMSDIKQIRVSSNARPVLCLIETCFPLILGAFAHTDPSINPVVLPLAAITRLKKGRIMYCGSANFLSHTLITSSNTAVFIENCIMWAADMKNTAIRIQLAGFSPEILSTLVPDMTSLGYQVESKRNLEPPVHADVVIISTNIEIADATYLRRLVERGAGAIVFAETDFSTADRFSSPPINWIFRDTGIAFSSTIQNISQKYVSSLSSETLEQKQLHSISNSFFEIMKNPKEINTDQLDTVVVALRYYVAESIGISEDIIIKLLDSIWDYFSLTCPPEHGRFCSDDTQQIFSVLLGELLSVVTPTYIRKAPGLEFYPGITRDIHGFNIDVSISVPMLEWASTGIWLPPGHVVSVISDTSFELQVGSHTLALIPKPGPWKRWSSVTRVFHIVANELTQISSPFGGLVYFISERATRITATLRGVISCPYVKSDGSFISSDSVAPWGEIETARTIITLPSSEVGNLASKHEHIRKIDEYISYIEEVVGGNKINKYHIIFDVELPTEQSICDEAIFINISCLSSFLTMNSSSYDFVSTLVCIALSSITGCLNEQNSESVIANVVVAYAISCIEQIKDAKTVLRIEGSRVFELLWMIVDHMGYVHLKNALRHTRSGEKTWENFVKQLEISTGTSQTELSLHNCRPDALQSVSSDNLKKYQLSDFSLV